MPDAERQDAEVARLDHVWARYDGQVVLEDINLAIRERDFLGIIGPNGAGKTTLLKLLLGLVQPTKGKVQIFGGPPKKNRYLIGYVPQYSFSDLDFPVSVWEVVLMARLKGKRFFRKYNANDHQKADEALHKVGLDGLKERQIGRLSGGERQKALIARALASEPRMLLLDEPTASVDKAAELNVFELLQTLNREIAIVMVSHNINAVSRSVRQIACLNRKLHYHGEDKLDIEALSQVYGTDLDWVVHGDRQRILNGHD